MFTNFIDDWDEPEWIPERAKGIWFPFRSLDSIKQCKNKLNSNCIVKPVEERLKEEMREAMLCEGFHEGMEEVGEELSPNKYEKNNNTIKKEENMNIVQSLQGLRFNVKIDGKSFRVSKVSGIGTSNDGNLLKIYKSLESNENKWWNFCKTCKRKREYDTYEGKFYNSPSLEINIEILDVNGKVQKVIYFPSCYLVEYSISDLNADSGDLLLECISFKKKSMSVENG